MYKHKIFRVTVEVDDPIEMRGTFYIKGQFMWESMLDLVTRFKGCQVEVYDNEEDIVIYNDTLDNETPEKMHKYVVKSYQEDAVHYLESLIGLPDGNGGEVLADDIFKAINLLKGDIS